MLEVMNKDTHKIMVEITKVLHEIGMPAHIKGYRYTRYAIMIVYFDPNLIGHMMGRLYPAVAEEFVVSVSCVERAMRSAIELAWYRGNADIINSIFKNTVDSMKAKPTNSEFVAMIADKLRLEMI